MDFATQMVKARQCTEPNLVRQLSVHICTYINAWIVLYLASVAFEMLLIVLKGLWQDAFLNLFYGFFYSKSAQSVYVLIDNQRTQKWSIFYTLLGYTYKMSPKFSGESPFNVKKGTERIPEIGRYQNWAIEILSINLRLIFW